MEIITQDEKAIRASRLCTLADYARKHGVVYTTMMNRMFRGKIDTVKIGNIDFVVMSEEEAAEYASSKESISK